MVELATSEPDCGSVSAKAEIASAGAGFRQPFRFLFRGAEQRHAPVPRPLHGKGKIGQPVMARQRFAGEAQAAHIERRPVLGRCRLKPAGGAQRLDQRLRQACVDMSA
jgi:hypothetical protein